MQLFTLKTAYIVEIFNFFIDILIDTIYNNMDVIHNEVLLIFV
jgi:hypothetical protein